MPIALSEYYTPHVGQQKVHRARPHNKVIILRVGRRWGKSRSAIGDLLDCYSRVLDMPRDSSLVPPFFAWVIVPSYPQGGQIWRELKTIIPKGLIVDIQERDYEIWLRGGSNWQGRPGLVQLKSAFDDDSLQGAGLDYCWFSESHDIDDEKHEKVWPSIRSPGRMGWVMAEGVPPTTEDHWFERIFRSAKDHKGTFAYHGTTFENPMLTTEQIAEIESDRDILSAMAWERQYLAKFDITSSFFRNIDACTSGDLWTDPLPGVELVGGLDPGRTQDPTVLHIMDANKRKLVGRWSWDSSYSWVMIREQMVNIHEAWGLSRLVVDTTALGGVMVQEDLEQTSLPVVPFSIVGARRTEILERLAGAMERQSISYPKIPPLIRQLRAMQLRKMAGTNKWRTDVPRGEHDDEVFALALAYTECNPGPPVGEATRLRRRSYAPTQAEVDGLADGPRSPTAIVRGRVLSDKIRQRAERVGITI